MKTGIFYGSNSGNTRRIALRVAGMLELEESVYDISEVDPALFFSHDFLILGTPTWDIGKIQEDWGRFGKVLSEGSLKGKFCVLFGLGDQGSYPDTFADGLGILAGMLRRAGANILHPWPNKGYSFASSLALEEDLFTGLVLDEDCQPGLTEERLSGWVKLVKPELKKQRSALA
ncbi:MAG: flavodoxin [Bacteroidales bacterium]